MLNCFFGRTPPPEIDFLLRVLDTSDVMGLAGLYGEARDRFQDPSLMEAVNKRMSEVIARSSEGGSPSPSMVGREDTPHE